MRLQRRRSGRLVDDILDRGDHGVGGLFQDLHVVAGRRREHEHALVARLGLGGGTAHRAHLLLRSARVGSAMAATSTATTGQ
jgi:hypothetical protein